jgi:DNA-binding response OmpR family regulator
VAALVVEGDPQFAASLSSALAQHGMRTDTARDGLEALYALEHETPDLIVLDLDTPPAKAPAVSGFRLARLLGQDDVTCALPVLVLSSLSFQEAAEVLRDGADDYFEKPVSAREVAARARQLLERLVARRVAAFK